MGLQDGRWYRNHGAWLKAVKSSKSIGDRILGRVPLDDIKDPYTGEVLVKANEPIDEEMYADYRGSGY